MKMRRAGSLSVPRKNAVMRAEAYRIAVAAVVTITVLSLTPVGERLERFGQDVRFALRGPRPPRPDTRIVLVTIGPAEGEHWKATPILFWGDHFAEAIRAAKAAGATFIGLDVVPERDADAFLEERGATGPDALPDAALENAIRSANRTICLSYFAGPPSILPALRFREEEALTGRFGFVDLPVTVDGVVREVWTALPSDSARPSLPALLASLSSGKTTAAAATANHNPLLLDSVTPPPIVPLLRLAPGDGAPLGSALTKADRQALRGAVVLIGFTDPAMKDLFDLPGFRRAVPGLELLADAFVTLREGRAPQRLARAVEAALVGLLGITALGMNGIIAAGRTGRGRGAAGPGTAAVFLLTAAYIGGTQWLFAADGWLLPAVGPPVAVLVGWGMLLAASGRAEAVARRQTERIFGRYLSPEVRDHLLARPENQRLGGEVREATLLFFDIRDSTKQAETMPAADFLRELNAYLGVVIPAVERHGGFINSFLGDGFLALFGVPDAGQPTDVSPPLRAVRAAQGIVAATEKLNRVRQQEGRLPWKFGCGVHTGQLVAGSMGDAGRAAYTVIGDPVNLASRLEGLSKEMKATVVLSAAVYDRLPVGGAERNGLLGPHPATVRGRAASVLVYWLPRTAEGPEETNNDA